MAKWQPPHDYAQQVTGPTRQPLKPGQMVVIFPPGSGETDTAGEAVPPAPLMVGRSPDGRWRCIGHLGLTDNDELVVFRLEVRPWDDTLTGLGYDALRNLPLSRWLTAAHSWLTTGGADKVTKATGPARAQDRERLERMRRQAARLAGSTTLRPGPKGFGEDYYRRIALEYLALQPKIGRGIRIELAAAEGKRQKRPVTPENIRDALNRATELGFLSKGTPGRAGRQPGPRLYEDEEAT